MFKFIFRKKSIPVNKRKTNKKKTKTKKNLSRFQNDGPNDFNEPLEELSPKGDLAKRNIDNELEVMWLEDEHKGDAIKYHQINEPRNLDDGAYSVLDAIEADDKADESNVTSFWSRWKSLRRKKPTASKKKTKSVARVSGHRKKTPSSKDLLSTFSSTNKTSKNSCKSFSTNFSNSPDSVLTEPKLTLRDSVPKNLSENDEVKVINLPEASLESYGNVTHLVKAKPQSNGFTFKFGSVVYRQFSTYLKTKLIHFTKEKYISLYKKLRLMMNEIPKKLYTKNRNFASEFELFREAVERQRRPSILKIEKLVFCFRKEMKNVPIIVVKNL
jgi:hypothetical protein